MPGSARYRQGNGPARRAQGARRRDALLDVPGARRLDERAHRDPSSPTRLGLHANTVRLHLERLREAGLVDVEAVHRGTVGRPAARLLARAGRARARVRPAQLHAPRRPARRRSPSASAPTATTPPQTGRRGASRPARRTRSRSCVKALASRDAPTRLRPAEHPAGRHHRHGVHRTARSGSWPRPTRSWCATSTAGSAKDGRRGRRGKRGGVRDVVRPRPVPGRRVTSEVS